MRRAQRSVHRFVWPILLALLTIGFALALILRDPA
jgi:hypothetical protein